MDWEMQFWTSTSTDSDIYHSNPTDSDILRGTFTNIVVPQQFTQNPFHIAHEHLKLEISEIHDRSIVSLNRNISQRYFGILAIVTERYSKFISGKN
jgi:hypothetical protein